MKEYYEGKVSYITEVEGKTKMIKESYLLEAESFEEVETLLKAEMTSVDNLNILEIKKSSYLDVLLSVSNEYDFYYKGKIKIIMLDEETGKEKSKTQYYLINASSVDAAFDILTENVVKTSLYDMEIKGIYDTSIVGTINL